MQKLKEDVRQRILQAALDEFSSVGYQSSSLRIIAAKAQITVGNIYAYFANKDALLDAVLMPTINEFNEMLLSYSQQQIATLAKDISTIYLRNRQQFLLLMSGCAQTRYAPFKEQIRDMASVRLQSDLLPKLPMHAHVTASANNHIAFALATALIEGLMYIFMHVHDETQLHDNVEEFMTILFGNIL